MRRTTPVRIAVQLEKVEHGGVLALATVEINICGILVTLQGLELRRGLDGVLCVHLPMFDHPGGGCFPIIGLHDDLSRGVVDEIISVWKRRAS